MYLYCTFLYIKRSAPLKKKKKIYKTLQTSGFIASSGASMDAALKSIPLILKQLTGGGLHGQNSILALDAVEEAWPTDRGSVKALSKMEGI